MSWRQELEKFLHNEIENTYNIKLKELQQKNLKFEFLGSEHFVVELNSDANVTKVISTDFPDDFMAEVNEFCKKNCKVVDVLKRITKQFREMDDDDDHLSPFAHDTSNTPTPGILSPNDLHYDPFDSALVHTDEQLAKDKQRKIVNQHIVQQVERTQDAMKVGSVIQNIAVAAQKDYSKKADRELFVRFFVGGLFTVDDSPPRKMDDPNEKTLLESLSKGFVPEPYARGAKDVDLHVIHESCTYEEYLVKKKTQEVEAKQDQKEAESEWEAQIMAQVMQESLALYEKEQQTKQPAPSISVTKPLQLNLLANPTDTTSNTTTTTTTQPVQKPAFTYACDKQKPYTSIQVRFADGSKSVFQMNIEDTVSVLYDYVDSTMPQGANFSLIKQGFPPKQLTDKNVSIKDEKLESGTVLVKQIK